MPKRKKKPPRWIRDKAARHSARTPGLAMDPGVLLAVKRESGKRCAYCGRRGSRGFHVDHRIPLCRGGTHARRNLCMACPTCNLAKGRMTAEEFEQSTALWLIRAGRDPRENSGSAKREAARAWALRAHAELDAELSARIAREP